MAREYAGLTQQELAQRSDLKQQQVSQLETGEIKSTSKINRIALACKVNPFWLSDEIGDMVDETRLTEEEKIHLALHRAASPKTRQTVEAVYQIEKQSRDIDRKAAG